MSVHGPCTKCAGRTVRTTACHPLVARGFVRVHEARRQRVYSTIRQQSTGRCRQSAQRSNCLRTSRNIDKNDRRQSVTYRTLFRQSWCRHASKSFDDSDASPQTPEWFATCPLSSSIECLVVRVFGSWPNRTMRPSLGLSVLHAMTADILISGQMSRSSFL